MVPMLLLQVVRSLLRQCREEEEVGDYLAWQKEVGEAERKDLVSWISQVYYTTYKIKLLAD